jgi:hypothetical protein
LKQALIILIVLSILSCNESNNKLEIKTKVKTVKPIAEILILVYYSEFNVVQDTIKGDNFGTIIRASKI